MALKTVHSVFCNLEKRLEDVEFLVDNIESLPVSMRATLSRIVVEGRSLTNILQNLKNRVSDFEKWYVPKQAEMRSDELLRYFYELRSETLKEGEDRVKASQVKPQPNATLRMDEKGVY